MADFMRIKQDSVYNVTANRCHPKTFSADFARQERCDDQPADSNRGK